VYNAIQAETEKLLIRVGVFLNYNNIMKKSLKSLELKKQTISNLNLNRIHGGSVVNSMFCHTVIACLTTDTEEVTK